ncbi:unnamed protein product [Rotaria magnacalcarata]|uniref:Uncharacterized protein n=1 Tax=Rotaria magnacalcarata TaxID=392030 RepID=A0A819XWK6_9BILA|nr:unnamed protein product [Rotaria magnacalcarata]CAF1684108.1 unnamed protein product [Rotaria magnacalcarata]CAF1928393.1 unnamed protein product [Rotaria magnacalcarata]CAF2106994.1 unnamed protein product [Rotaria magnacalcarata]CAF2113342.1 unnamed protein product [Rotaria magnacalcarata]
MVDVLYRSSMNVSPHPAIFPSTHNRRFRTKDHSPVYLDAAPIAVNNKIKAIQARKTPLTLLSSDHDHTDIRQLNFGYNGGVTTSRTDFSVLTAERLVDRSKDIRLDRYSKRQNARQSVLSTTSIAQHSSVWPKCQVSSVGNKHNHVQSNSITNTPPAVRSIKNKSSPGGKIPDINRRRNRQPFAEQANTLTPIETQKKSILKTRPSQVKMHSSLDRIHNNTNHNHFTAYETEEDDDDDENILLDDEENTNIVMDEEFERYLQAALIKCADWLIKYVFNQTVDEINA